MSRFDSNDPEVTGYFLPEDSQLQLKKLREYVEFLANLARPRMADEAKEWPAEIRPGEVAICLEQLEEQIAQVLGELSRPAERGGRKEACETDAEAEAVDTETESRDYAEPVMEDAGNRHLFSVTLNQIDEINLLLDSLRAHGNVVTCSDHAEFADVTLSIMGDAIVRDAEKLRDIIDDIHDEQRLGPPHRSQASVREERATYLALPARLPSCSASYGSIRPVISGSLE